MPTLSRMEAMMTTDQQADGRRLDILAGLDILDTPREPAFDRLTKLCRTIFDVPMSTLTFIDGHRQWFKASEGLDNRQTERRPALCNLAIQEIETLVISDTFLDRRVSENVFVRNSPFIRFYAGAQIRISGVTIGSLCAMDTKPRSFDERDIAILKDLAAVTEDELLLRNLSMQDSLTGALSRRAFRSEGEQLRALAVRHGHKLACSVLDVDNFKSINDRYGHAVGDIVLAAVVNTCRNSLRGSDIVGRLGGEEFGILLPHTNLAEALAALEKARAAVASRRVETPCGPISVTCSFGGAALSAGQNFDDLLHCADMAMYGAKNAGRNQVVAWIDPAPSISPVKRRVLKAGQLTFNAGRSSFDCTISALSQEAATLKVISSADVPDKFKLVIPSDGISRACSVVSKRENQIEVAFA
jgi:diguanylate cyclase (GGDEF)-like protein